MKFKAAKDLILLSGGEAISKVIGFVAFAYLARTISPETYGIVEIAAAMLVFFNLIVDLGYGPIGAREISKNEHVTQEYVNLISTARFLIAIVAAPLMCIAAFIMNQSEQAITLIWIYSIALLASPWNQNWLFQGMEKMHWVSVGQLLRMSIFCIGIMLFVNDDKNLLAVGYIEVIASMSMAIFFITMQYRHNLVLRFNFDLKKLLSLSHESISFGLSQSVWAFNQYLPTFLIASLVGATEVAWFGVSHRIVISLVTFSMIYHFNLFPTLSKRLNHSIEALFGLIIPSFKVTLWGGVLIALSITLFAEQILVAIYGDKFNVAAPSLAIAIWALPFTLLNGHGRWTLAAAHKQRYILFSQLAGTVAAVTAGFILVPLYGATGGAITMALTAFIVWISAHYHTKKHVASLPFIFSALPCFIPAIIIISIITIFYPANIIANIAGILLFIIIAPVIDRKLISDLVRFLHVKHFQTDNL